MPPPSRRLIWFGATILVPCAALLYLGLRLLSQEDQIARQLERETVDNRVDSIRRGLHAVLEPIRAAPEAPASVAFHGVIRNGEVQLSWEVQPAAERVRRALADSTFQSLLRNPAGPAPASGAGAVVDFLLLHQAIALDLGGHAGAAAKLFFVLAEKPATITDDHAVPLSLYAIPHLLPGQRTAAIGRAMESILTHPHALSPTALRMTLSLARDNAVMSFLPKVKVLLENAQAGEEFQAAYARDRGASSTRWQSFGSVPFLIGYTPSTIPGDLIFRAVRANEASPTAGFSLSKGYPLGEPFPGLRTILADQPAGAIPRQRPFVLLVLVLAFAVALFGSMLLWRDFRRDAQIAALRTQFVAGVSHELRTPLTAIRMFTEALHDNPALDAATRQEYLSTMLRESERLSRLVENVLEFSRIERNRQSYHQRPVSLPAVIQSVLTALQPILDQGGFHLQTSIAPDLPTVLADPDALGQALSNLLGNAMKYSGQSRDICLQAVRDGAHAAIRVVDSGIGIPPAEQRRIFDRFYRAQVPENDSIQGAGLGLALVLHVMRGHNGDVTVQSQTGRGSTFTLLLPIPTEEPLP